jgi:hypothetical protein
MALHSRDEEWYPIAVQVVKEMDPVKLGVLVARLCSALDAREKPPSRAANLTCQSNLSITSEDDLKSISSQSTNIVTDRFPN